MKKTILTLMLAAAAPVAFAQVETTSTTTTTTVGTGQISAYTPGSVLTVKEEAGPVSYTYGDSVTYVTKSGTTLTPEEARAKISVGMPVAVSYDMDGDSRVAKEIEIDDDGKVEVDD